MDAKDELTVSGKTATEADLAAVKGMYETIARAGVAAGIEELVSFCHEDVEMWAYAARAVASAGAREHELLRGRDEIRAFFRDSAEVGFTVVLRTRGFDLKGDTVLARGSIRVGRPDGSFAETSVLWTFRFRDGLAHRISWEQRAGD
jgi:hypothetical protein